MPGVKDTTVGYIGGTMPQPTYRDVCGDGTGHAEAVQVEFDPARVSYDQLLQAFWGMHDPTTPNRQGPDVGSQYRSAIFVQSPAQEAAARASLQEAQKHEKRRIVTAIEPAPVFYPAEEYHQHYYEKKGITHG